MFQLFDDKKYLKNAYEEVQNKLHNMDSGFKDTFIQYPIYMNIINLYETNFKNKELQ